MDMKSIFLQWVLLLVTDMNSPATKDVGCSVNHALLARDIVSITCTKGTPDGGILAVGMTYAPRGAAL